MKRSMFSGAGVRGPGGSPSRRAVEITPMTLLLATRASLRLLLQPHGFEGVLSVHVLVEVDDLAVRHLEMPVEPDLDRGAASLPAPDQLRRQEHAIVRVEELLDLGDVLIPSVEPSVSDSQRPVDSAGWRVVVLE